MQEPRGLITIEDIESLIRNGEIDTVVTAFPDHLGRLVGKRVVGEFFLEHVLLHPLHACEYLLAVDTEMTPLPGFQLTSWEKGYGDFQMWPDFSTLRIAHWLEKTALILCDVEDESTGEPVPESPRSILKNQVQRAEENGYRFYVGSELEFYLFNEDYRTARAKNYENLGHSADYIIDYHILATTYDEPLIREIRNHVNASGIPVEFSKGEWGKSQHEINLRYASPVEMADRHTIYKTAAKEIAAARGRSISFMAKYSNEAAGNSCHIHLSLCGLESDKNLFWNEEKAGPSDLFRWFVGGLLRGEKELCLLFAPNVNSYKRFESGSFAPTAVAWSEDNRTCSLRCVGKNGSFRIENRLPGADVNPYLAFAAMIGAGLWGIRNRVECGLPYRGDAYSDPNLQRVPATLEESIRVFESSELALEILGPRVRDYLLHSARLELEAYQRAVTDWERHRYFERI